MTHGRFDVTLPIPSGTITALLLSLAMAASARSLAAQTADLRFVDAVQRQDWTTALELLNGARDVNAAQADGATPLAWAAHWNRVDLAERLIRVGADIDATNDHGVTPLALACENASVPMVKLLLDAGANPNRARTSGETPLMTAGRTGSVEVLKLLLASGGNPNAASTRSRQTALMHAISERHSAAVRTLVEAGADVGARSAGGFTPLLFAARHGDTASAALLLDRGAGVNDAAPDGSTPLMIAIASGREDTALLFLERGADPHDVRLGYAPLHAAVARNALRVAKALLASGADPNARLMKAPGTVFGRPDGAGTEVRPPNASSPEAPRLTVAAKPTELMVGATPFWLAARLVNGPMMKVLLEGKADPAITLPNGTTALMVASGLTQVQGPLARRGDVSQYYTNWNEPDSLDAVRFLVEVGADVNAANASGQAALHGAAYMGGDTIVQFLVQRGAKLDVPDAQGQTPYRLAEGHLNIASQGVTEWPKTAALLRQLGADPMLGVDGRTMLRKYGNGLDRTGKDGRR